MKCAEIQTAYINGGELSDAPFIYVLELPESGCGLSFQTESDRDWMLDKIKERHGGNIVVVKKELDV